MLTFQADLEAHLSTLRTELLAGTYRPGPYTTFTVREPKTREIAVAPFRDRVVHHAMIQVCEPRFERFLIHDTYACRQGKGTHRALERAQAFARTKPFFLKIVK